MADAETNLYELNGRMVWDGFRQLIPLSVFVTLFGAAFGLAAVQAGLDDLTIVAMSMLVFAGALALLAVLPAMALHTPQEDAARAAGRREATP